MYVLLREPFLTIPGLFYALTIDLMIVVLIVLNVLRGFRIGFLRQFLGFIGFIVGMFMGVLLVPVLVGPSQDRLARTVVTIIAVVGVGVFVGWVAELIAKDIKELDWRYQVRIVNDILGAAFSGLLTLGIIWLLSAMFLGSSLAPLATGLQRSFILRTVSAVLPTAPTVLTHIQTIIDPNDTPQVFVGLEPWPAPPLDKATQSDVTNAVTSAGRSIVQIESYGCGGLYGGTGFVMAAEQVMTNAHVVAGIKHPIVLDRNGAHSATTILFDVRNDVAILRVDKLSGKPLSLNGQILSPGAHVAILGFPDSGPFMPLAGAVLNVAPTTGRDIYNRNEVTRTIYTVQADIRPGSSGSPLIALDGSVAGMVYGRSLLADGIGYAIASSQIAPLVLRVSATSAGVSTGSCTAD